MRLYIKLAAFVCAFAGLQWVIGAGVECWEAGYYLRARAVVYRGGTATDQGWLEDYYNVHRVGASTAEILTDIRRSRHDAEAAADEGGCAGAIVIPADASVEPER